MENFSNPSKKPRLDEADDLGNADLWGQYEITAEEFDLLEFEASQQASQIGGQGDVLGSDQNRQAAPSNVSEKCEKESSEFEQVKQEQYALLGKNISLSAQLEKTVRDLNDERSRREQIIEKGVSQLRQSEKDLKRELENIQTVLKFKEHEVKVEKDKVIMLESKLREMTRTQLYPESSVNDKATRFSAAKSKLQMKSSAHEKSTKLSPGRRSPKRSICNSFDLANKVKTTESGIQTEIERPTRKFPLPLLAPKGETQGTDIVCKLLNRRIVDSSAAIVCGSVSGTTDTLDDMLKRATDCSSASLVMLRNTKESDDVWKPYETVLQEYVNRLKIQSTCLRLAAGIRCNIFIPDKSHSDLNSLRNGILSCLRDLTRLLFYLCPTEIYRRCNQELFSVRSDKVQENDDLEVYTADSLPLFNGTEEKVVVYQNQSYCLLELLIKLANPSEYPKDYERSCEVEWALAALVAWSSHSIDCAESCVQDLPLFSLISGKHGMECAYLSLKLVLPLVGLKSFENILSHNSDTSCILCCVGSLCMCMHDGHTGNCSGRIVNMVLDFLSGILTSCGFSTIAKISDPCYSQVIQGIIIVMLKEQQSCQKYDLPDYITIMTKGVTLMCFMSNHVPNFKRIHMEVEGDFIELFCLLFKLCTANPTFKNMQDMIRDLWEYQEDSSDGDGAHNTEDYCSQILSQVF